MAQMTGIATIDLLLDEWRSGTFRAHSDLMNGSTAPVCDLRDPAFAAHRCVLVSDQLVEFLRVRGLDRAGREAYMSGDEWDGDVMLLERISPDDFGYHDRPVAGCNSHTVCMLDWDGERFMVDFTAAQYGYSEFPLVQRLIADTPAGAVWERICASEPAMAGNAR